MIIVIIIAVIVVICLFKIYISIKHPFWNRQPVFHIYKLYYLFYKGIIYKKFPKLDKKYFDLCVQHLQYNELSNDNKKKIQLFIKDNWYDARMKTLPYMSSITDIAVIKNKDSIKGIICGEMLRMGNENVKYIDYLCINKKFRKKNIAPKLIYNFFLKSYKNTKIFLFKWENKKMNIIPLCVYNVLHYKNLKFNINNICDVKIIQIEKTNFHLINFTEIKSKFKISFVIDEKKLLEQINSEYVLIFASMQKSSLLGLYFFYNYGSNNYNLYSSIKFCNNDKFIQSFRIIINSFKNYKLSIENLSNSNILIDNINKTYKPYFIETHSYYFYNYIHLPEISNDVLVLS